jgi:UDP-glucuronate 4-epimerase
MNILVTGGAGFIGSHLIEKLLQRGDSVICIDNFNDSYDPLIKRNNISGFLDNNSFSLREADICDYEAINNIFKSADIDVVVHLAARAGVRLSLSHVHSYIDTNIGGTINILEATRLNNIKKIVFASSSSVYGNNKTPFSENQSISEPVSPYAATKITGENLCYTYHHLYGLNASCLRFFTVYGPRGRPDMAVYKFTRLISDGKPLKIYGDLKSLRDFTYVDDIVDGTIAAIDKDFGFEAFNLGNSKTIELGYLIETIEHCLGKKAILEKIAPFRGDIKNTLADTSKAREMLCYNPKSDIEEGIKKFVDWFLETDGGLKQKVS